MRNEKLISSYRIADDVSFCRVRTEQSGAGELEALAKQKRTYLLRQEGRGHARRQRFQ